MHHCDICDIDFEKKEQLAGHNSAHVRRGEKPKRIDAKLAYPRKCDVNGCNTMLASPAQYGGHKRKHLLNFESLANDGTRKLWLLAERGHHCEICTLSEWREQKIPIEIDHIDGNPDHNERSNLRLICPNCHAQQPTHAGRNARKHKDTKRQIVMSRYPSYRQHGHTLAEIQPLVV